MRARVKRSHTFRLSAVAGVLAGVVLFANRVRAEPAAPVPAAVPAEVRLVNGDLRAQVYLPDAISGHYRGRRFDGSGMIGSVSLGETVFWDEWNPIDDPASHDANAVGPAMEFDIDAPPGYAEAKVGDPYMKIGVGELRRTGDGPYRFNGTDPLVHFGTWHIEVERDSVSFSQQLKVGPRAYRYDKRVRLVDGKTLRIDCVLANTGSVPIETEVYTHNFLRPGGTGWVPGLTIDFDRPVKSDDAAKTRNTLEPTAGGFRVARPLPGVASAWAVLGFDHARPPRHFTVTSGTTRIAIDYDFDPSKIVLFGLAGTVCVEPFHRMKIDPGTKQSWVQTYHFRSS